MNKLICSIVASLAVATSLYAGQQKAVVAPAAPEASPFYVAIDGGLNFAQNGISSYGWDNTVEKVGWTAGLKLGYDFNQCCNGLITPAAEIEGLYTNFTHNWDQSFEDTGVTDKARVGTFAYMANGIAKFNLGAWQPYAGVGIGWFSSKVKWAQSTSLYGQTDEGSDNRDGFAWQALAGVDYKLTSNVSVFTEYKWLDCVIRNHDDFLGGSNLGQHLVTAGVRYHF